eukprot:TRINITY_DN9888_c0_g1_i2.p1 TRINITY_DN9888_c0_g1~~TRINITY_DN9888_c0_g1_i2.p1  ORF type:complete len:180 (+),score=31.86 TRINITY_DN9888_c0_g1_i2:235-774(+)
MGWVALIPIEVSFLHGEVRRIALGEAHTLVLNDKGEVYAAGWNECGQRGSADEMEEFEVVRRVSDVQIVSVSAGALFSAAVDSKGSVYTWGNNEYGQLGVKSEEESIKLHGALEVVCGERSALAYCKSGKVYGWGSTSPERKSKEHTGPELVISLDIVKYYGLNPKPSPSLLVTLVPSK